MEAFEQTEFKYADLKQGGNPDESLIRDAFLELYPDRDFDFKVEVNYTRRMKSYNAGVFFFKSGRKVIFRFAEGWRNVSPEIKKGLVQELFLKLFGKKNLVRTSKKTTSIELYHFFIKQLHLALPKTQTEPLLEEAFERVNERYFNGLLEKPNLAFGKNSFRKLAGYDFQSDTITVSKFFKKCDKKILDYLLYHELLHKKLKFEYKNGRNYHHTSRFKYMERRFKDADAVERELNLFLKKIRREKKSFKSVNESVRKPVKKKERGFLESIFDFSVKK